MRWFPSSLLFAIVVTTGCGTMPATGPLASQPNLRTAQVLGPATGPENVPVLGDKPLTGSVGGSLLPGQLGQTTSVTSTSSTTATTPTTTSTGATGTTTQPGGPTVTTPAEPQRPKFKVPLEARRYLLLFKNRLAIGKPVKEALAEALGQARIEGTDVGEMVTKIRALNPGLPKDWYTYLANNPDLMLQVVDQP